MAQAIGAMAIIPIMGWATAWDMVAIMEGRDQALICTAMN